MRLPTAAIPINIVVDGLQKHMRICNRPVIGAFLLPKFLLAPSILWTKFVSPIRVIGSLR